MDRQSAKHHVLVMHYCFEATQPEIDTARIWASKNEVSDERVTRFRANQERYKSSLDGEVARLNAFMTAAMSQLEQIRLKYRRSGFFCQVPVVASTGTISSSAAPRPSAKKRASHFSMRHDKLVQREACPGDFSPQGTPDARTPRNYLHPLAPLRWRKIKLAFSANRHFDAVIGLS